jgi:hypothetical protein
LFEINAGLQAGIPWAMEMKAVSSEDPWRLMGMLAPAIVGCGGWVLCRAVTDAGMIKLVFEFERRACVDIYAVLIAAGVELSPLGHMRLTELCQCTRSGRRSCGEEIASVELEIKTFQRG